MLKVNGARTVLARKILVGLLVVGTIIAATFAGIRYIPVAIKEFTGDDTQVQQSSKPNYDYKVVAATIGTDQFALWVADTPQKQELGLGQRQALPAKQGMIFPYPTADVRCFWMKDMNFSIDMIWLDANKRVVHIEPKVSPDTYPKTFCPPVPASYVVELLQGTAERVRLKNGDQVSFTVQ
jgi:uncharacterized membrane protein (UPF0127 family)